MDPKYECPECGKELDLDKLDPDEPKCPFCECDFDEDEIEEASN